MLNNCRIWLAIIALIACPLSAHADEGDYEISLRYIGLFGDGIPSNDILGFGVAGRRFLNDGWFVGAALERYEFDFERPITIVGLMQDPNVKTIDSTTTSTVLSGHLGRRYGALDRGLDWFWSVGLGVGFPDVKDVTGPTSTGGTFDLTTDAGTEFHLMGALGTSYRFSPQWSVDLAARAEHHFMDYKVLDRDSGATGKIDSQSPLGVHVGFSWRF